MERKCPTPKRNGDACRGTVLPGSYHCWAHNPANADKRRRGASKGGKGNRNKAAKDLHVLLETLTEQVLDGTVEPYPGSVVASIVGVRLRLLEYERKVREQDELLARIEAVEEVAARDKKEVRRWHA